MQVAPGFVPRQRRSRKAGSVFLGFFFKHVDFPATGVGYGAVAKTSTWIFQWSCSCFLYFCFAWGGSEEGGMFQKFCCPGNIFRLIAWCWGSKWGNMMTDGLSQGGRHAGVVWMEGNSNQCVKRGRRVNKHENASQCGLQTNSEEIVAVVPLWRSHLDSPGSSGAPEPYLQEERLIPGYPWSCRLGHHPAASPTRHWILNWQDTGLPVL